MKKQQTALNWFLDQSILANAETGTNSFIYLKIPKGVIQKAREMEKEQITKAFNIGNASSELDFGSDYFKKSFKK